MVAENEFLVHFPGNKNFFLCLHVDISSDENLGKRFVCLCMEYRTENLGSLFSITTPILIVAKGLNRAKSIQSYIVNIVTLKKDGNNENSGNNYCLSTILDLVSRDTLSPTPPPPKGMGHV